MPFLSISAFWLPGLGRRIAGGAFQQWSRIDVGDYPARAFYGVTVWLVAVAGGAAWLHALLLVPAIFLGCAVPNFSGIAMGRSGNRWWRDAAGMLCHGVLSLALAALVIALPPSLDIGFAAVARTMNWTAFGCVVAVGVACPVLYEIGWSIAGLSGNPRLPLGFRGGSELGEFLWGVAIGVAVILAVGGL
jgi:hypothetical protein